MPVRGLCRRTADSWLVITDAGLAFWDRESNACRFIVDPYSDNPDIQFNDGIIDRQGRLLVGSFNSARLEAPDGSLYRLDTDHGLNRLDGGLVLSNGIAISPGKPTLIASIGGKPVFGLPGHPVSALMVASWVLVSTGVPLTITGIGVAAMTAWRVSN